VVETGAATFHVGREARSLLGVVIGGRPLLAPESARIVFTDSKGREDIPRIESVDLEARGPVRATVRLMGVFGRRAHCRLVARLCFFAGTGLVRVRLTLHNPRRARHPGGVWDLGDPGSVLFRDLTLELALAGAGQPRLSWATELGQTPRSMTGGGVEIYQDSSGGEYWRSRNHVNREGRVPCTFRGYRVRHAGQEESGLRANPVVSIWGADGGIAAAIPDFWQQFPKALEIDGRTLRARLFPRQFGDLFELQGGEQKTHTLWLDFGPADGSAGGSLDWVQQPARVHATPDWIAASGVIPYLAPAPVEPDAGDRLESLLAEAVAGDNSLGARREIIDEYGWRNFGDIYADHEAAYYKGDRPVISHYNNQYDFVFGMILQFLRTGDTQWFDLLEPLDRHVVDIDIYHTDRDRAAYHGGLFWHTDHYRDAATCTHRTYSRANRLQLGRSYGGGPCAEHNYTTGLLHYYYLTGDPLARDAVISLTNWVGNADDGRKSILGLIDDGPTGKASGTAERDYHGPGRGCGNSINVLLDGWLLTGQHSYLETAEALIRRSIHPADDILARDLLEPERRWSYTVFLSTLDRYLDLKAEAGQYDALYGYARASLLHYANWMLEHEIPYFDRPEKLEYPTETWAAQEFRKANVLRQAAAYAEEPLRARLLARGGELADRAWADLLRFESRGVARSLVILLREGTRDSYFRKHPIKAHPCLSVANDFGEPEPFVAQKRRVLAELRTVRGLLRAAIRVARAAVVGRG